MLDKKSKGKEITFAPPEAPRHGQIIDLMQALKRSIEEARPKAKAIPARGQAKNCFLGAVKRKAGNTRPSAGENERPGFLPATNLNRGTCGY
jgi:hypothetical protein